MELFALIAAATSERERKCAPVSFLSDEGKMDEGVWEIKDGVLEKR